MPVNHLLGTRLKLCCDGPLVFDHWFISQGKWLPFDDRSGNHLFNDQKHVDKESSKSSNLWITYKNRLRVYSSLTLFQRPPNSFAE